MLYLSGYNIIHIISSNRWGGAEQYALDICRHYRDTGANVIAITRDAKAVDSHFIRHHIPLLHAPLGGILEPAPLWKMVKLMKSLDVNRTVFHFHRRRDALALITARRIAKRPDIRIVATHHTVDPRKKSWLYDRLYSEVDAHIFVSRTALSTFVSSGNKKRKHLIPDSRIHLLHNSLNLDNLVLSTEPRKGPIKVICHGAIVPGKGFETIIDAFSMLRDLKLRLRIAGNGNPDYIDTLRRRAIARSVMEAIDWISAPENIIELILDSHIGLQASGQREGFALENLRYMACGRPQVCVPNGAQSEYLTDGVTAVFAPPADATRLASAVRLLASDSALRQHMGREAYRQFHESMTWKNFVDTLNSIYFPAG